MTARKASCPRPRFPGEGPVVPLLWTGGWDSTFRLLTLLLIEKRRVQPCYVVEDVRQRASVPAEREAMRRIRAAIAARYPVAIGRLAEPMECPLRSIAPDPALARHYERCLAYGFIGGQYEWLARFCLQHGIEGLELAIHKDDKARALIADLIDASGTALDARFEDDSRYELFRFFRFPLFDWTKLQMREEAAREGFEDIMGLTWFCHRPRNGKPCGVCNPCIYTIEEGLGDRVPRRGHLRYEMRVLPRIRHWLARYPDYYLAVRAVYRRLRRMLRASSHGGGGDVRT